VVAEDRDALEQLVEGTRGLHLAAAAVRLAPSETSLLFELAFPFDAPAAAATRVILRPQSAPLRPLNCGCDVRFCRYRFPATDLNSKATWLGIQ
jgi:hypothetical protein